MKKYQLPKDFATKWVAALRSGDYKQGAGMYFDPVDKCYCSMGVGLVANSIPLNRHGDGVEGGFDPFMECMPLNFGDGTLWYAIYKLNDTLNYTFPQIADFIEDNVEFI